MAECQGCGTFVTARYAHVFGGNDGKVYSCQACGIQMSRKDSEVREE